MYNDSLTPSEKSWKIRNAIAAMSAETESYPQKTIPNVRKFRIKLLSDYHPVFLKAGIKKREFEPIIDSEPYLNKSINRYIRHQFERLNKSRTNPALFWRISEHLLHRSGSYLSLCLHETLPGWHRKSKYGDIWQAVTEMRALNFGNYDHTLKSIPKAGGHRHLNIPTLPWRLYLHGLNLLLQIWLSPYQHPDQHGFVPGRGTATAWKKILTDVIHSSDIYEFDLKKFFDTINLDYLNDLLKRTGVPPKLRSHLIRWSRTPAKGSAHSVLRWSTPYEESSDYKYHLVGIYDILSEEEHHHWLDKKREAEISNPALKRYDYYHGIAQGSPTSPLLSTIILNQVLLWNPYCRIVQYADDGILYNLSRSPSEILQFPGASGIRVNWAKSGWIRKDGEWLNSLKFLGLRWTSDHSTPEPYVSSGKVSNATSTPRPFTFEHQSLIDDAILHDKTVSPTGTHPESFEAWFKTKYHGFIMSRLYHGSLNIEEIQQDFSYSFKRWSWADLDSRLPGPAPYYRYDAKKSLVQLNVFNSSSFAHKSLANRINKTLAGRAVNGFRC